MSSRTRMRRAAGAAVEVGCWWGVSVGVWLLTLSSVTGPDLCAAIGCGLPCGLAARAGRHAMRASWRPRLRWAWWLLPLPAAVAADAGRLALAVVGGLGGGPAGGGQDGKPSGELREVPLAPGEPAAVAAAHRALAALTISFAPGSFVLETHPEENVLVVHSLAGGWPHLERAVSR